MPTPDTGLVIEGLAAGYGAVQVLRGVDLRAAPGQVTCLMGRNGAGKTTLLRAIMGQVAVTSGTVALDGTALHRLPAHRVPVAGVGYVPQGRRLFGAMTVDENLSVGLLARGGGPAVRARVLDLFPRLRDRLDQVAGTLSGGEQQMLALARALCLEPTLLLFDEPTEGLQPSMIALIRETVTGLKAAGVAILLVEQRVDAVRAMADRVVFLEDGRVAETVAGADLPADAPQFRRYVGV